MKASPCASIIRPIIATSVPKKALGVKTCLPMSYMFPMRLALSCARRALWSGISEAIKCIQNYLRRAEETEKMKFLIGYKHIRCRS